MRPHSLEAQVGHGPSHLVRVELLNQVAADGLQDIGGRDELARLALMGQAEPLADQFAFNLRRLKGSIVTRQSHNLLS